MSDMKSVLVLGAGMVCKPLTRYLLDLGYVEVTLCDMVIEKAEAILDGHVLGTAVELDMSRDDIDVYLGSLVADHDLTVSFLPYTFHCLVADLCIANKRNLLTASYVSEEMKAKDSAVKEAGIVLLNECGLDPGIDHMSAMKIVHDVEAEGGKVDVFRSSCGALVARECATNPLGYKFSWSPRGVLMASRNDSKYLQDGEVVEIEGKRLFENYCFEDVPGAGCLENYPNRDSVPYKDVYNLKDVQTLYRGTLRYVGWCETLRCVAKLGWLTEDNLPKNGFTGNTYGDVTRHLMKCEATDLEKAVAEFLDVPAYSAIVRRIKWLGLLGDRPLPVHPDPSDPLNCPLDHLNHLTLDVMKMEDDDRDMVVMNHEFEADFSKRGAHRRERITSTMIYYGDVGGDTAVAKTVALPAAIAVKLMLDGTISTPGVKIPVEREIYEPILKELESYGITFVERKTVLND